MPPSAEDLVPRLFLGPALRTQSDRRLVRLVREGYETAFEEIVRRYGAPLRRYAAAIVGGDADDVTQDSFSKALLALRRDDAEIELRPWLYRIVRNTALNDLRDRPAPSRGSRRDDRRRAQPSRGSEQREELTELMTRLRALPEPQRAAIVMRELEGLSHEEIAAALGVTGGAARQAIHRARTTLRDAAGFLIPIPLLRMLIDHGAEATAAAGAGAGAAAAGASIGGAGGGTALKAGLATALIAGSVGTGVALKDERQKVDTSGPPPQSSRRRRQITPGGQLTAPPSSTPRVGLAVAMTMAVDPGRTTTEGPIGTTTPTIAARTATRTTTPQARDGGESRDTATRTRGQVTTTIAAAADRAPTAGPARANPSSPATTTWNPSQARKPRSRTTRLAPAAATDSYFASSQSLPMPTSTSSAGSRG